MATKVARLKNTAAPVPTTARADGASSPIAIYGGAGDQPNYTLIDDFNVDSDPHLAVEFRLGADMVPNGHVTIAGWYGINLVATLKDPQLPTGQAFSAGATLGLWSHVTTDVTTYDNFNWPIEGHQCVAVRAEATWSMTDPDLFNGFPSGDRIYRNTTVQYFAKDETVNLYLIQGGGFHFLGGDTGDPDNFVAFPTFPIDWQIEYFLLSSGAETEMPPPEGD